MIPDQRLADQDEERHAHRWDMHPALLACDPLWTPKPEGNPLFAELCSVYGADAAFTLWELAGDWHHCELLSELRYRALGDVA